MARRNGRTPREALEMFRAEGKHDLAAVLERLLEAPRPKSRLDRRREMFPDDVVSFLEEQDRRRLAARRLPALCPFTDHAHALGCVDPLAKVS